MDKQLFVSESGTVGEVIAAIDINEIANSVYAHNFPETTVLNKNILGLTADFINKLDVNAIFMSPPCQPFTRNGLKKDNNDARAYAFLILLDLLPNINAEYILIENVKGFEVSECRNILLQQLKTTQYTYQEFILSPHQFGVPNNRHRYYCLAKKLPGRFNFDVGPIVNINYKYYLQDNTNFFIFRKTLLNYLTRQK